MLNLDVEIHQWWSGPLVCPEREKWLLFPTCVVLKASAQLFSRCPSVWWIILPFSHFPNPGWNREFSQSKGNISVQMKPNSHSEHSFFSSFFLIPFLQALSSNKQLFQTAALIKRNVLISPRLNIMLLCYHWSKSSKIQNKNISLICSRSGMSWRNSPSLQVCPILRKKRGRIKMWGLALGPRSCWGRNARIQTGQAQFLQIKHSSPR